MSVEIAHALYNQNALVGLRDVHLPGGWHLNARRVPVPPVPHRGHALAGYPAAGSTRGPGLHHGLEMVGLPCLRALSGALIGRPQRCQVRLRCGGLPIAAGPVLGAAAE
jgi:hypothetical protein